MARWFPTKARLRQLKAEGVFPWSSLATRSCVAAAVVSVLLASPKFFARLHDFSPAGDWQQTALSAALSAFGWPFVWLVAVTAVVAIAAGLLISWIQTRGVCSRTALRTVMQRERSRNPLPRVCGLLFALNLACCIVYVAAPKILSVALMADSQSVASRLGSLLFDIAKLMVVTGIVLAVVLVFVCRLVFLVGLKKRYRHMAIEET